MRWLTDNVLVRTLAAALGIGAGACGCTSKQSHEALLAELEDCGFFRHISAEQAAAARAAILSDGWGGIYAEGRFFHADAEHLAEGGVGEFLNEISPFLHGQGVRLDSVQDNWGDHDYTVTVNGQEYLIWSLKELAQEEERPGLTWGLSTVRTFAIVNGLLARAGSAERLYALNGGNDLAAIFLTEELRDFICTSADLPKQDWPYTPVEDDDWYGLPH